ncbi:MAG: branched-chain amino acid ABC transporter permease [Janthinobacterium lividum]
MLTGIGILFDGVAYGALLFLISIGLSVTLGLMRFANLAHGVFFMIGGYAAVTAMKLWGLPLLATLPLAFIAGAVLGAVLESLLYRRLYGSSVLDQVLFTMGLVFIATAAAVFIWGDAQQAVQLPAFLQGQLLVGGLALGRYRLFLILFVVIVMAVLLLLLRYTRFGAQIRASVDNRQAAAGLGINVGRVFTLAFALGSGLAGLGGALGVEIVGLDPNVPMTFLVIFLMVAVVGGAGSFGGALIAALILGIADVGVKYYLPSAGAFVAYPLMIALLFLFPHGLLGKRA